MANLTETPAYEPDIYELAVTDPVLGGPGGVSNTQAQQLANRTAYLLDELNKAKNALRYIHPLGELQILAGPAYNAADYDEDSNSLSYGLGKAGTPAEGWALCNGINGTADLRGRFAIGIDPIKPQFDTVGNAAGSDSVSLGISNMPPHAHKLPLLTDNRGTTQNGGAIAKSDSGYNGPDRNRATESVGGSNGSAMPFSVLNPYYVVVYRQRVAN